MVIGNNNRFTKQVTIDAGTDKVTEIGNHVIMLKNSHVGHDARVHDHVIISVNAVICGHTEVFEKTNFGVGSVAHQRTVIPENCMIGMNAVVTKKSVLQAGKKYAGVPVRCIGDNVRL